MTVSDDESLRTCVRRAMERYFAELGEQQTTDLLRMVTAEVEAPLFAVVMRQAGGNQCKAARMLGINRGTLRKKLRLYRID